jgi:small GTP-binding protein
LCQDQAIADKCKYKILNNYKTLNKNKVLILKSYSIINILHPRPDRYLNFKFILGLNMAHVKELKKKICVLGDPAVGKTSLIRRYVYDEFDDKYITTLGAKVSKKELFLMFNPSGNDGYNINMTLSIWDILGQKDESTLRVRPVYYKGSSGALLIVDITRRDTLESLDDWIRSFYSITGKVPMVLLGNKVDLYKSARVFYDDLDEIGKKYGFPIFLTSAKTGSNVESAFYKLSDLMVKSSAENSQST